jgi:hypothetical protein
MDKINNKYLGSQKVVEIIKQYPQDVQVKIKQLRQLIFDEAEKLNIGEIQETLKWGEPSYISPMGSTIRLAWKQKTPNEFGLYFNCNTILVETFLEIYPHQFRFEGKRAIIFNLNDEIPEIEIRHCISLALNYHKLKNLAMLGV